MFFLGATAIPAMAHPIFRENQNVWDGIFIHEHLVHVFVGWSRDELAPPTGGRQGVQQFVMTVDLVDKTRPFGFVGPLVLPAGFANNAWTVSTIDPPDSVQFVITANTAAFGNSALIQSPDQVIGFDFSYFSPAQVEGYPVLTTFQGIEPGSPRFGETFVESDFHQL